MTDWQPIETAPKDGIWVLLYSPPGGFSVARYWPSFGFRGGFWDGDATHWMPLPAPPAQEGEG
jgi:hypothetical protein